MRPRKNEVQRVVALLEKEHADVEELAFQVLNVAWELLQQRETWSVIVDNPGAGTVAWGPYESESQARRAIGKEIIASSPGAKGTLTRLYRKAD